MSGGDACNESSVYIQRSVATVMPSLRSLGIAVSLLLALGSASSLAWAADSPRAGHASASTLVAVAERAVAQVAELSFNDPRIVPATRFWDALEGLRRSLGEFGGSLGAPSPALFRSLGAVTRRASEVRGEWRALGIVQPQISDRLGTLDLAVEALRAHCGWEAARLRRGGDLSPEERRRLAALQGAETRLARELAAARERSMHAGDRATADRLAALIAEARQSAAEAATLEALARASFLADRLRGEWAALSRRPSIAQSRERQRIEPVIEKLATDAEAGYVFALDLGGPGAEIEQQGERAEPQIWSFVEEPIDLSGDLSPLAEEIEVAAEREVSGASDEAAADFEGDEEHGESSSFESEEEEENADAEVDDPAAKEGDQNVSAESSPSTEEAGPIDPTTAPLSEPNSCGPDCPSPFEINPPPPPQSSVEPPPAGVLGAGASHSNSS